MKIVLSRWTQYLLYTYCEILTKKQLCRKLFSLFFLLILKLASVTHTCSHIKFYH